MSTTTTPTRREMRRAETVREMKALAMEQIAEGGPDAVSLSGIVRSMSMSPAAVYRYFANRDALLADLVVDAYNELADFLIAIDQQEALSTDERLDAVLRGTRAWALRYPNSYRLIFQTSIGSGQDFAVERTVPASSRSMSVVIEALAAVAQKSEAGSEDRSQAAGTEMADVMGAWAERVGLTHLSPEILELAVLAWTRLHGIISLELGGHLAATGIGADILFDAEVTTIHRQATQLPRSIS